MPLRIAVFLALTLLLAACGRQGAMLRPEPGVTVMKETDKAAATPVEDNRIILDELI